MRDFFSKFLIGIILVSFGTVFFIFEIFNYEYMGEKKYSDIKTKERYYTFEINSDKYYVEDYNLSSVKIEIDESMGDTFKVVIKYPYQYMNVDVESRKGMHGNSIYVSTYEVDGAIFNATKDILRNVFSDLKNKKVYSYHLGIQPSITIYIGSENENMIVF